MFALEIYKEALASKQFRRAAELGRALTSNIKTVARDLWAAQSADPVPF